MLDPFEKQRQSLLTTYEAELNELDSNRDNITNTEYWKTYKSITTQYQAKLKQIDAQQRAQEALQASTQSNSATRPEATYSEVAGQLKAEKMAQLISDLINISSDAANVQVDPSDPFYQNKKNPLDVFEHWWVVELEQLPSISEIRKFLSSIYIDDRGYIRCDHVADSNETVADVISDDALRASIRASVLQTAKERKAAKQKQQTARMRRRYPLLAKSDKALQQRQRKAKSIQRANSCIAQLESVVDAYALSEDLSDLLYEHIEKVCVPKGMLHVDEYQPMLERFLTYVTSDKERKEVVRRSIQREWRVLSNGSF